MSATVKSEPTDNNGLESMILNILQSKPEGLTDSEILAAIPQTNSEGLLVVLNKLLGKNALHVGKVSNGRLFCKLRTLTTSSSALKGVDSEERLVYQIIEEAGRKGIWNKDIQEKCKINNKQLDKILKSLEGKKLVKKISSVASARKKIYMLFNLEPDESVTGGVFYSDQRFDSEYVDLINKCCLRILQQRAEACKARDLDLMELKNSQFMSSEDILKTLTESNVSKVRLTLSDIELIMQTLIYDGKVEKNVVIERHKSQTNLYRATTSFIKSSGLMHTPCGHCPVRTDCRPGNAISPEKCIYMSLWLDF